MGFGDLITILVSLIGFVSVLLIFRYQTSDQYVDSRKAILRDILVKSDCSKKNESNNTYISSEEANLIIKIQDIGKNSENDVEYLSNEFKENKVVNKLVREILYYRSQRECHIGCTKLYIFFIAIILVALQLSSLLENGLYISSNAYLAIAILVIIPSMLLIFELLDTKREHK